MPLICSLLDFQVFMLLFNCLMFAIYALDLQNLMNSTASPGLEMLEQTRLNDWSRRHVKNNWKRKRCFADVMLNVFPQVNTYTFKMDERVWKRRNVLVVSVYVPICAACINIWRRPSMFWCTPSMYGALEACPGELECLKTDIKHSPLPDRTRFTLEPKIGR